MRNIVAKVAPVAIAVGLLAGLAPPAAAGTLTLQNLLDGASIQVGNEKFSNFSCKTYGGCGIDPNLVYVSPVGVGGEVGLNFQSSQFTAAKGTDLTIHLEFDVKVGKGGAIHGSELGFLASAGKDGNAAINGSLNYGANYLGVSTSSNPRSTTGATPGSSTVHVSLNITLNGGAQLGGFAKIDSFTILFNNPEPGSLTLLSIGVIGLAGYGWRRKARQGRRTV
jgi:hypothetical protein